MSNEYQYRFIYKCRLCGAEEENPVTGNESLASNALLTVAVYGKDLTSKSYITLLSVHVCSDGSHGIADLQGYRKVKL